MIKVYRDKSQHPIIKLDQHQPTASWQQYQVAFNQVASLATRMRHACYVVINADGGAIPRERTHNPVAELSSIINQLPSNVSGIFLVSDNNFDKRIAHIMTNIPPISEKRPFHIVSSVEEAYNRVHHAHHSVGATKH